METKSNMRIMFKECLSAFNLSVSGVLDTPPIGSIVGPSAVCEFASAEYTVTGNFDNYNWTASDATVGAGNGTNEVTVEFVSISSTVTVVGTNICGTNSSHYQPAESSYNECTACLH